MKNISFRDDVLPLKNVLYRLALRITLSREEAEDDDPYERAAQRDRVEQVRRIVDSLPEKQRSCMQLRDFEGKSYKEIALALAISEEQVKVNIFRARQAVKQKFDEIERYGL